MNHSKISWEVVDIEDLVIAGKSHSSCPYYLQKERLPEADVILTSYSHLINQQISGGNKGGFNIDLEDSLLIIDEGHNISENCDESMSFQIESALIEGCIEEL